MNNMPREPGAPYGLPAVSAGDRASTRNPGPLGPGGFNPSVLKTQRYQTQCSEPLSTATLNEHGETFDVSTAGTNAMATLCVASRSCQGRRSSM